MKTSIPIKNTETMKQLEDIFKAQEPKRDFGTFMRHRLDLNEFLFNRLEAYALVRIDAGSFMLMSEYEQGSETFNVTIYFSKSQILTIAEGVSDECSGLSLFLLELYQQPFSLETADFMEIDFPYRASIWLTISARLLLESESEYSDFFPFMATQIIKSETEDWLA
jgi:hypothetical protein